MELTRKFKELEEQVKAERKEKLILMASAKS